MWKEFLNSGSPVPDTGPPGPENQTGTKTRSLRWVLFLLVVLYMLVAAFHVQILQRIGGALVVEHEPSKSDLIVTLAGGNIERALASADLYHRGLAPRIFIAPEEPPDGYDLLRSRGIEYPRTVDQTVRLLQDLKVPESAIVVGRQTSNSTRREAEIVRDLAEREKVRSLILVTSPTHTRRVFWTFSKILDDLEVRIQVVPSPYSGFRAEDWWKHRKYARQVIAEYEKLAYYYVRELR